MKLVDVRIAEALERIADALEAQNVMLAPDEASEPDVQACSHPKDAWIDMGVMGNPGRGKCGVPGCDFSIGLES